MDSFLSHCFMKLLNTEEKISFGIKVQHWINLLAGSEFLSQPKILTEIWPFKPQF